MNEDQKHVRRGNTVYFLGVGTAARVVFATSPFQSGSTTINVPENGIWPEIMGTVTGQYHYTFSCRECGGGAGDADLFLDL